MTAFTGSIPTMVANRRPMACANGIRPTSVTLAVLGVEVMRKLGAVQRPVAEGSAVERRCRSLPCRTLQCRRLGVDVVSLGDHYTVVSSRSGDGDVALQHIGDHPGRITVQRRTVSAAGRALQQEPITGPQRDRSGFRRQRAGIEVAVVHYVTGGGSWTRTEESGCRYPRAFSHQGGIDAVVEHHPPASPSAATPFAPGTASVGHPLPAQR